MKPHPAPAVECLDMNQTHQIATILRRVAADFCSNERFILGPLRTPGVCNTRAVAASCLREVLDLTQQQIADALHRDSHSAVSDLLKRIQTQRALRDDVERLSIGLRERLFPDEMLTTD